MKSRYPLYRCSVEWIINPHDCPADLRNAENSVEAVKLVALETWGAEITGVKIQAEDKPE